MMVANEREAAALAKLLKLAKARVDEASRRIAELKIAAGRVDDEIRLLVESVYSEESASRAAEIVGFLQLAGFLAGAAQKRAALEQTKIQIAAEIEAAAADLEAAHVEKQKLDHLIERTRLFTDRRRRRREDAYFDDAAIARFVRKSAR